MGIDELGRLDRFRRVGRAHGIYSSPASHGAGQEVDFYRGRLNAKLYLEADEWMLPSWAVLFRRSSPSEDAHIISLPNDRYRNWSLLGGPGAEHYAIADSRGLITAASDCGSIDVWVSEPDGVLFPALTDKEGPRLRLISTEDQIYEWKTDVGPVEVRRLVYHVERDDGDYVYNEIVVKNLGLESAAARFHIAIRPMSPLGFEPIEAIDYSRGRVAVNSVPALLFSALPNSVVMTRADDEDLLRKVRTGDGRFDSRYSDSEGLATAILTFEVRLGPAGTERLFFASPIGTQEEGTRVGAQQPGVEDRDSHVESWFSFSEEHTLASFPNDVLDSAFQQCLASLAMQVRSVLFPPDVYHAAMKWSDRARVLQALIQSGCDSVLRRMVRLIVSTFEEVLPHTDLETIVPLTWALLSMDAHGICPDCSEMTRSFILSSLARILSEIEKMAAEAPAPDSVLEQDEETEAPLQHYVIVGEGTFSSLERNLWLLATMISARSAVARWKEHDRIKAIENGIEVMRGVMHDETAEIRDARWPRPQDPVMESVDSEILGFLSSLGLLGLHDIDVGLSSNLAAGIESRRVVKGLWKSVGPENWLSSHLHLRLAHYYCQRNLRDKAARLMNRALEFLSEDFLLPDYVNTRTFGGSAGAGSSVLAAADFVLLIRCMLLREEATSAVLLPALPDEWYTSKRGLVVENLPTTFDRARIEIGMSANQHQIEFGASRFPEEIEVHVPVSVPVSMVKAFGASIVERASKGHSPHLKVVPLSDTVVFTFFK